MKFNWGHGITMAIIIMVLGMLWLVYRTTQAKIDLVTEEYYPKELVYEQQLQKMRNNNRLAEKIVVAISDSLHIQFPKVTVDPADIKGQIMFYRPSDKSMDFTEKISLNSSFKESYPLSKFEAGKYEMSVDWSFADTAYLQKEILFFNK